MGSPPRITPHNPVSYSTRTPAVKGNNISLIEQCFRVPAHGQYTHPPTPILQFLLLHHEEGDQRMHKRKAQCTAHQGACCLRCCSSRVDMQVLWMNLLNWHANTCCAVFAVLSSLGLTLTPFLVPTASIITHWKHQCKVYRGRY